MKKGKNDNDNGCRYGGTPAPNVCGVFFFLFLFPTLLYHGSCMLVNLSACRVSMLFPCMHVVCNGSGVRFCGCCCFCVMMPWYGVGIVCSVANGLVFMVVVLDMVVLFMDGNGGLEYLVCGLTWFHDDWITAP